MSITTSRRSLLAASAWSVPAVVVASGAPAYATSGVKLPAPTLCTEIDYTFSWQSGGYNFEPNSRATPYGAGQGTGPATRVPGAAPLTAAEEAAFVPPTVTFSNSFSGNRMRGARAGDGATNMRVSPFPVGGDEDGNGRGTNYGLTLLQDLARNESHGSTSTARKAHAQTLKIEFGRPVKNLQFTISDIDSASGQYRDRVSVSGNPTATRAPALRGTGTATDPWRNSSDTAAYDPSTSGSGNVIVNYGPAEVSTVLVTFWNDQPGSGWFNTISGNGLQGIFLSNLTFRASSC